METRAYGQTWKHRPLFKIRERSEIIRKGGLQIIGEGHDILCYEKGRVTIFSSVI